MEPAAYFDSVEDCLVSDTLIATVGFVDRWQTDINGYFWARLIFATGQRLEFAEYVQRESSGNLEVVTYAYQLMAADNRLLCRWGNTPHYLHLPGFPCYRHDGGESQVVSDAPRTFLAVLEEIARRVA